MILLMQHEYDKFAAWLEEDAVKCDATADYALDTNVPQPGTPGRMKEAAREYRELAEAERIVAKELARRRSA